MVGRRTTSNSNYPRDLSKEVGIDTASYSYLIIYTFATKNRAAHLLRCRCLSHFPPPESHRI
jgi:hypothetical protein